MPRRKEQCAVLDAWGRQCTETAVAAEIHCVPVAEGLPFVLDVATYRAVWVRVPVCDSCKTQKKSTG